MADVIGSLQYVSFWVLEVQFLHLPLPEYQHPFLYHYSPNLSPSPQRSISHLFFYFALLLCSVSSFSVSNSSPSSPFCRHGLSIDVNDVVGTKLNSKRPWIFFRSRKYFYTSNGNFLTEPTSANLLVTNYTKFLNWAPISHLEKKGGK